MTQPSASAGDCRCRSPIPGFEDEHAENERNGASFKCSFSGPLKFSKRYCFRLPGTTADRAILASRPALIAIKISSVPLSLTMTLPSRLDSPFNESEPYSLRSRSRSSTSSSTVRCGRYVRARLGCLRVQMRSYCGAPRLRRHPNGCCGISPCQRPTADTSSPLS
jgi:hypothetical protein